MVKSIVYILIGLFYFNLNAQQDSSIPTFVFFSHGLGASSQQATNYAGPKKILPYEWFSFNYPEAETGSLENVTLGQDNEIALFNKAFCEMIASLKQRNIHRFNIIVMGVSRGASTIINWMATASKKIVKYVTLVILESPFDSVETIIKQRRDDLWLTYIAPLPIVRYITKKIACGRYDHKGIHPRDSIVKIKRKDIPLFIIWSKKDRVVPYTSSKNVYDLFKDNGHAKLHGVSLNTGSHANLLWEEAMYAKELTLFLKTHIPSC